MPDDFVLAGSLVQKDLRPGVAEEMGIDLEAAEAKHRGLDLRAEPLLRFRFASFPGKQSIRWSAHKVRGRERIC
jgi:hypothetical protein